VRRWCALALTGLLLSACVPASPDADTYDDKAAQTLGAAISETRTAQRLLETLDSGRMLLPTAAAQMRSSESSLGTATTAFTELNPPPARDHLNSRVSTLLDDASGLVADARIAIAREQERDYSSIADDLAKLADKLERLEGRVS
jgi:hypothetical protein